MYINASNSSWGLKSKNRDLSPTVYFVYRVSCRYIVPTVHPLVDVHKCFKQLVGLKIENQGFKPHGLVCVKSEL